MKINHIGQAIPESPTERVALIAFARKVAFESEAKAIQAGALLSTQEVNTIVDSWIEPDKT